MYFIVENIFIRKIRLQKVAKTQFLQCCILHVFMDSTCDFKVEEEKELDTHCILTGGGPYLHFTMYLGPIRL